MNKPFLEVFPNLKLNKSLSTRLEPAFVERASMTKDKKKLKVYLYSERLILKEDIYSLEKELKCQMFGESADVLVKVIEHFSLSSQYTLENTMEEYRDSILLELKYYDRVLFNMFKNAEISYPDRDIMHLLCEEHVLNREKEGELIRILEKVFCERLGVKAEFGVTYRQVNRNRQKAEEEEIIRKRISESAETTARSSDAPTSNTTAKDNAKTVDAKSGKSETAKEKTVKQLKSGDQKFNKKFDKKYDKFTSDNPDVYYGKDFDTSVKIKIEDISDEMEEVVVEGQLVSVEPRPIKNEKTILIMSLTDFTDTIAVKLFLNNEMLDEVAPKIKSGSFVIIKGMTQMDRFDGELIIGSVKGIKKGTDTRVKRMDRSLRKRVELHLHTKMSDMDGVSDIADIMKTANSWGMKALAITDHGNVQGHTEALHAMKKVDPGFKMIYGVEGYLIDDLKNIVTNNKGQSIDNSYVVFDLETTGFSCVKNKIIEIGAVKVVNGEIAGRFSSFVNPQIPIPYEIEKVTNINDSMVANERTVEEVLPEFMQFCEGSILVAHNADFDMSFIIQNCKNLGIECDYTYLDTVELARLLILDTNKYTLDSLCKKLKINLEGHHRAVNDAEATAQLFIKLIAMLNDKNITDLSSLNAMAASNVEAIRKKRAFHIILLAKNETGRINLYKLVSESHVNYFGGAPGRPKIPKSLLEKNREGIIVGSACEAGELYRAIVDEKSPEIIAKIVSFYDYLEIQPLGNNAYMIADEKHRNINSFDDIIAINKQIVSLGEKFNKPVVATCDVHFLNPEDEIYRRILMAGSGFPDADNQAPLYLRTTEEMLAEFDYLPSDKAEEIVITNTNMIADMCDYVSPVRPDKCPPVIDRSDEILREICNNKAHELYGENLPEIVEKRMNKELDSIINNGFAVMYIIAQKLVWKSVEDGYLVGSRGSVGSSFVAFLSGITEVNSLSAHYRCASCFYTDFDSEEVKAYSGMSGADMPDKVCPVCGKPLIKDGFDIPFETFLGFNGDKEPDIDLNFSGEYQSKAHKYTEVIFGYGQTFRAGTIGAVADKTAYGYVKKYYEERGIRKRRSEIERISVGCTGVRRTTGQHPGGIVVLPVGEEINSFTPVQRPANDMTTATITTHFDYHSIDHNLLKLDILGHDDPTMIRMLQDLTGVDPTTIPLDDKNVMSLFQNTSALGITPSDIGGIQLGSLGIPEFGTDFAMQMVIDAKPTCFTDLIRISGLSHGTNVWLGNAETLIKEGKATISTCISTRDDIMIYLIQKGLEPGTAFKIMENVRKGKVAKGGCDNWPGWREMMLEHDVPEWYCWSCEKIEYMFPKAHAAAYVMMAWRIAYCKIYYPLAYYAAFFSIRAKAFSYEMMCQGKAHLERLMKEYKDKEAAGEEIKPRDKDAYSDMKLVLEMYARGFEFEPIDIFKAQSRLFSVTENGKIMPSLIAIDGVSEMIGDAIVEACKDGPFLSKDDFVDRTKCPKGVADSLLKLGILGDIPESNQLSLFDFL
ncbi:MAG: PolC-type DNA polymerase III [Lachnospiraceae bacterium]|nr:PolC-type DNA polymerase III [Candidatus Merdinaster equi]